MTTTREAALEAALNAYMAAIEHADMSDGVCCCGDNMEGHSDPMNCGHSPVDMGEYHAHQVLSAARAALSMPTTELQAGYVVKPLVWEDLGNGRAYRAACPLFGSIRVESYYSGDFHVLWSVPGFCSDFTPGLYDTAKLAQAAAQADYTARILAALEPQFEPRDEVIAKLVDALHAIEAVMQNPPPTPQETP